MSEEYHLTNEEIRALVDHIAANPKLPYLYQPMSYYEISLTDTKTGETKIIRREGVFDDGEEFIWNEGNYSCDCNRHRVFYNLTSSDHVPCGHERFTVILPKVKSDA